jgi:hypothetical protein
MQPLSWQQLKTNFFVLFQIPSKVSEKFGKYSSFLGHIYEPFFSLQLTNWPKKLECLFLAGFSAF